MFTRIQASNMFSWESLDYKIPKGLSQVTGKNLDDGNGEAIGKSAIFNILCWTLFGKIPKDVRIDEVIRHGQKSCDAAVHLENGHTIVRTRNPNDLCILPSEGFETVRGKDAKETQILVEKLIGMSFETFCQAIYFSQNHDKKFITSNETEKAKILSDIQDLDKFDKARNGTISRLNVLLKETDQFSNLLWKNQTKQVQTQESINLLKQIISDFEVFKDSKIARLQQELQQTKSKLISLQKYDESKLISLKELLQYKKETKELGVDLAKTVDHIVELEKPTPHCKECGSILSSEQTDEHLKRYKQIKADITTRQVMIFTEFFDENTKPLTVNQVEVELEECKSNIAQSRYLNDVIIGLNRSLNQEATSNCERQDRELTHKIQELEALKIEETLLKETLSDINSQKHSLEVLKDGFKEIKSHVFGSVLIDLSIKATSYASELFEVPVSIRFHNESEGEISKIQTIIKVGEIIRSYGLLSGGQARRVQIATDLALSEIVSKRALNPINFRILDEASKDLSTPTIERLVSVLEGLAGSTVIVDHNPIINASISQVFDIQYENGISKEV